MLPPEFILSKALYPRCESDWTQEHDSADEDAGNDLKQNNSAFTDLISISIPFLPMLSKWRTLLLLTTIYFLGGQIRLIGN